MTDEERQNEAHWAKLHVRSDKSKPVRISDRAKRLYGARGGGTRFQRGGHRFEEERN